LDRNQWGRPPHREEPFLLERERERERERRRSVFFVGVEVKGYEEEGVDKTKQGKGVCPDAYGILTVTRGGLTMCLTKPGGQTDCLGWSDRWLLILLIKLYLL
jgi:hypothetical protein